MTKEELLNRINDLEWDDFEVKAAKSDLPKDVWETVSAFSNSAGGWIVLGVKQDGKKFSITGVDNIEKLEQDFINTLTGKQKFNVLIRPVAKKYHFDEVNVLAFYIPLSNKKPVYFNSQENTFVRITSGDVRATKEEIDSMYRDQAFGTKTSEVIPNSSIDDLNAHSIEVYRDYMARFNKDLAYNKLLTPELLRKANVLVDDKLTYGGLLFFGKQEKIFEHFPDFRIDLLEIPGTSYSDSDVRFTYRLPEQENIWEYYFALFERITKKIDKPFTLTKEGFATEDYPYIEALREATVNMLMHADYFAPTKSRVRIFTNRIEFFNSGTLPKPLEELLKTDISNPRNPIIAKLFRLVKLAENAGFGFGKMINGWKTYDNSSPEFDVGSDYTFVSFYTSSAKLPDDGAGKTREKTREKTGVKIREKTREKIINAMLKNSSITTYELAEDIGITVKGIEDQIRKLKADKVIERLGPDRGGKWLVLDKGDKI